MTRLFINTREIDFFNDISKELVKDMVGQKIYYYPISFEKSAPHPVYEESLKKVFEHPIEIECIVDWQAPEVSTTQFGVDSTANIIVHIQSRDLVERSIDVLEGCFFSYGEELYEITSVKTLRNLYGLVEYDDGIEVKGIRTRKDIFSIKPIGPTREDFSDEDATQKEFIQQRGIVEGDQRNLVDEQRISAPNDESYNSIKKPAKVGRSGFVGEGDE